MKKKGSKGYMKAQDLFIPSAKQIFCRKTGEFICLLKEGEKVPELFDEIVKEEKPKTDPNQIKLF